ncbi:Hypothetical protein PHPALM_14369 [Phytophthora palmivora]|uniref:Uncharacterized protein n=1 Tax=Phytophthora palmivora TaxID=4796 RepID=A0A2P4XUZ0_9STRA|nr:Hypothetical protein PHPALM_14369 [Phytophthora palmivora]
MYQKKMTQNVDVSKNEVMVMETKRHEQIKALEIIHGIGLLVARMLCPHNRRLADHWATTTNLYLTDNTDLKSETNRAWKVRSVVDALQETFTREYQMPSVLSFDEAMIPSRSRYNGTRQFMKD